MRILRFYATQNQTVGPICTELGVVTYGILAQVVSTLFLHEKSPGTAAIVPRSRVNIAQTFNSSGLMKVIIVCEVPL